MWQQQEAEAEQLEQKIALAAAAAHVPPLARKSPVDHLDWMRSSSLQDLGWMLSQGLSAGARQQVLPQRGPPCTLGAGVGGGCGEAAACGALDSEEGSDEEDGPVRERKAAWQQQQHQQQHAGLQDWPHSWEVCYRGCCNTDTVKDVAFVGPRQEMVAAGSDGGMLLLWDRATGRLVTAVRADRHAVNVVAPHPHLPGVMASCGIDKSIKVWSPCAPEPRGARASVLLALAENELKRAGPPAARRAAELGLGHSGWVPDGGLMRRRYLARTW